MKQTDDKTKMDIIYPPGEHEEVIKIKKYKYRLPEIIYLCNKSLSRDLPQECVDLIICNLLTREECIRFGYIRMIAPPYSDKEWITLIYRNNSEELSAAYTKHPVFRFSWLVFAIRKGCLESLKFLHVQHFKLYGNAEKFLLIDYVIDEFLGIDDNFEWDGEFKSNERYLSDGFPGLYKSEEDIITVMEWMYNNRYELTTEAIKRVICYELVKVEKWIGLHYPQYLSIKQNCDKWRTNYREIDDCIQDCRLDQVEKLLNEGCKITFSNIINCLCNERNFEMFKWLYSRYTAFEETEEFCEMCLYIPIIDKPFDFIDYLSRLVKLDFINLIDWEHMMNRSKLEVFEYALNKLGNRRVAGECKRVCTNSQIKRVLENYYN